MSKKVTQEDLVREWSKENELTYKDGKKLYDSFWGLVETNVEQGNKIELFGYLKFERVERKARKGRNPQTGDPIEIEEHVALKVSPFKKLKDAVKKSK